MRRLIVPAPLPAFALAAVTSHTTIDSSASAAGFTQQLSSFGIDLFATAGTPAAALQHAACVMDQYLDQDRDGIADDANVVAELTARQAAMVMGATEDDLEDTTDNSGSFGDRALQDVYASETAYDGATYFDASLEEVLHLITQHGYANAYPSSFGEYSGTTLADAIDAVIGDCEMSWECGGGEDEDQNNDDDKYGSGSGDDQNRGAGEQFCEESGFSQEECGSYDSSACACQWDDGQCWYAGGSCSGGDDGLAQPSLGPTPQPTPPCVNDDTTTDGYGDTCSSYYDMNPSGCGLFDDDKFTASEKCCACLPQLTPTPSTTPSPAPTTAPTTPTPTAYCLCNRTLVVAIATDNFPDETTWTLTMGNVPDNCIHVDGSASGGPYSDNFILHVNHLSARPKILLALEEHHY